MLNDTQGRPQCDCDWMHGREEMKDKERREGRVDGCMCVHVCVCSLSFHPLLSLLFRHMYVNKY